MRTTWKRASSVLALFLAATFGVTGGVSTEAFAGGNAPKGGRAVDQAQDNYVMKIPANAALPITRQITLGTGRSMMLQFPMELRDVMISDPERVDAIVQTNQRVFLIAKKPGAANAFFFDAQGNQVMNLEINVGSDLTSLDNLLKRLVPGSNIRSELAGASIALVGSVRTPHDAQKAVEIAKQFASANKQAIGSSFTSVRTEAGGVTTWQTQGQSGKEGELYKAVINLLTIEGEDQVMLKVTVAEINRTVLKQMGVNLGASFASGNFGNSFGTSNTFPITASTLGALGSTGFATSRAIHEALQAGRTLSNCGSVLPAISSDYVGGSGLNGSFATGSSCLSYVMKALERDGLVRTLAEPTLTAVSGESARFLAGGEYPVPVSSSDTAIGISFKEFGVGVAFTPTVLSEGRISLKIDTQVSELSNDGALVLSGTQIPSLRKRTALSTVELPSGGSIAMAGLISDQTRQNIEGFPGLKDVPILGTMFKSRDFQQSETELVVIVTPYLVRPTARQNLATPIDGLAPASDLKGNFLGHLNRVYGKGKPMPDGGLKGDHGYIVD
jgi:pilus assembly protein CpaC